MDLCQPHFLRSLFSAAVKIDIGFSKLIPKHLDISGHKSPEPGAEHLCHGLLHSKRAGQLRGRPLRLPAFRLRKCASDKMRPPAGLFHALYFDQIGSNSQYHPTCFLCVRFFHPGPAYCIPGRTAASDFQTDAHFPQLHPPVQQDPYGRNSRLP